MSDFDDPRLRFYLERKGLIDEWAKVRKEELSATRAALNRIVPALVENLRVQVPEGATVLDYRRSDEQRYIGYTRPAWSSPGTAVPQVLVGFSWYESSVTFAPEGDGTPPWVGVRIRRSKPYQELHRGLGRSLSDSAELRQILLLDAATDNWPVYLNVTIDPAPTREELDGLPVRIADLIIRTFSCAAPLIDAALGDEAG